MNRKMFELKMALGSVLRGLNWKEDDDLYGFKISSPDSQWTMYTVYCGDLGYSAYVAVPDIYKGIDCEDEKALVTNGTLWQAVNAIKNDHQNLNPRLYATAPPVNSNPQRAPHYLNQEAQ